MKTTKDAEEIKEVKSLIKKIKKRYGKPCPDLNVECAACKATILIAYLNWHLDNLEYPNKASK